jgi:hypothetical protein
MPSPTIFLSMRDVRVELEESETHRGKDFASVAEIPLY